MSETVHQFSGGSACVRSECGAGMAEIVPSKVRSSSGCAGWPVDLVEAAVVHVVAVSVRKHESVGAALRVEVKMPA